MTKKLISLLLALTMVFACAVPVMAINASDQIVNPDTGEITYQASYTQLSLANAPTDDDGLTVYLTIQSDSVNNQYITRYYYPVYMSTTDYSISLLQTVERIVYADKTNRRIVYGCSISPVVSAIISLC